MNGILRYLYFLLIVRPITLLLIGLNVRNVSRLPKAGPAIVVANHNSHLDTMVLMTLFGMNRLHCVHPVAAADHFFAQQIHGLVFDKDHRHHPAETRHERCAKRSPGWHQRGHREWKDPFAFSRRQSRRTGSSGQIQDRIAHVAKRHPEVSITPVFLHGLGKALPRGEGVLVPFFCDVFVGESLTWGGDRASFMNELEDAINGLSEDVHQPEKLLDTTAIANCPSCGVALSEPK